VFLEDHCLLFRREVFDRIGLLDEELTARSQLDLSLRLFDANLRCVLEPRARVTYLVPTAIDAEERAYYLFRWDPKRARKSEQRIRERWNIVDMPTAMRFVKERVRIARDADLRERWAALARR
jgi:GT2 family glycosyltransferase